MEAADDPRAIKLSDKLLGWIYKVGCGDELDPIERELLMTPLGRLGPSLQLDANAAGEAASVFLWMLNLLAPPNEVEYADQGLLFEVVPILRPEVSEIINSASLRDRADIEKMCRHFVLIRSLLQETRVSSGGDALRRLNVHRLHDFGIVVTDDSIAQASKVVARMTPDQRNRSVGAYMVRDHAASWFLSNRASYFEHDDE